MTGGTGPAAGDSSAPEIAYVSTDPGVPVFGSKGASVHVQEVLTALVRLGAKVKLFSSSAAGNKPLELSGVEVRELRDWPRGSLSGVESTVEAANESLRSALADDGPYDLVYERYALWSYAGMEYARSLGIPGTLEVNAPLVEEEERYRNLRNRALAEAVARRVYGASRRLVAVSKGVASYLSGFPEAEGKVHVVRNGVNPARFPSHAEPSAPARPGTFTVGFVGSLKPWHGLETLVDAYALLHEKTRKTRLLVVGDGPEKERLAKSLAARGLSTSCEFTGAVTPSEVSGFIASMNVGVAPYPDLEGFYFSPLKILEYMAAGKPVVASRVGDIPDLVRDGVDGLLVPPGDPAALGAALDRLRADRRLCDALGSAARAKVLDTHTWEAVVKRILDLSGMAAARTT